ncbi:hypothetical protein Lxx21050 [Leifsonia xyli subsp. xyli str. CTCB07]|uniref:Uncharacterized protein n=1 Tax=Leifsonia xyli subsp. xyli (strain CTCB07) TaxID=281090 RepID=Q6ACU0_LEIXX|nr:hypothetical protein Lxx21050 [Leifsonia xyli subsp. xyli str. CTCB07]
MLLLATGILLTVARRRRPGKPQA